ncbi:MAG: hypothetical protein LC722_05980 [Actinobacteria bacterium]|nr:hypothetical protein [Actinomycetota bacterium]
MNPTQNSRIEMGLDSPGVTRLLLEELADLERVYRESLVHPEVVLLRGAASAYRPKRRTLAS